MDELEDFSEDISQIDYAKYTELAIEFGVRLAIGLLILVIGLWIIKKLVKVSDSLMEKAELETSLLRFLSH
ncbi:MAG: mechanosensitive ion channel family protein, partial [Flavicella sp.]|nr:mechanosensitive ion channel family protein [Flavicella sp.]